MKSTIYNPRMISVDAQPMTTSLAIAEHFKKEHKSVLRAIREVIENLNDSDVMREDLIAFQHVDSYGRAQPIYRISEVGFSLVAMKFTGTKAEQWRLAYARTFRDMREQIKKGLQLDLVNKDYTIDYERRSVAILKTDLTKSLQLNHENAAQIYELSNTNAELMVKIGCYGPGEDVHENRMIVLQVLRQSRLDWLQLRETKTRYVIDPTRVSNAETVLRLTYALSKSQAAVLWLLLGMGEGVSSVSLSTLSIYTLLAKTKVSQSSIQVAIHKLADAGLISWTQSGGSHTPRSYWVNVDKVVDCLREYEQKWLHTNKDGYVTGSPLAGLTSVEGQVNSSEAKEFLVPKAPVEYVQGKKSMFTKKTNPNMAPSTQFQADSDGIGFIKPEAGSDGKAWMQ